MAEKNQATHALEVVEEQLELQILLLEKKGSLTELELGIYLGLQVGFSCVIREINRQLEPTKGL